MVWTCVKLVGTDVRKFWLRESEDFIVLKVIELQSSEFWGRKLQSESYIETCKIKIWAWALWDLSISIVITVQIFMLLVKNLFSETQ